MYELPYPDLFSWWVACISWSIMFLMLVSVYLYINSRPRRATKGIFRRIRDFIFVWVLVGLLALYVVSVNMGSAELFAEGNILVEVILVLYLVSNRMKTRKEAPSLETDRKPVPRQD
jgi:uncharacterized membrane protein